MGKRKFGLSQERFGDVAELVADAAMKQLKRGCDEHMVTGAARLGELRALELITPGLR